MERPSVKEVAEVCRVTPGAKFDLGSAPTRDGALFPDKGDAAASLKDDAKAIDALQDRLYAEHKRALLVVLQGMDASGKDGVTRKVFAKTSPLGVGVTPFKAPSKEELAHDYLWRVHKACPRAGHIGVFNRSHYEDVLIVRVREFAPLEAVERRYGEINAFEKHLSDNGVTLLKFMLHESYEEQGERLKARVTNKHKNWKFNAGDLEDRQLWPQFMEAYEVALNRCSTPHAPWYVIPADSKTRRNAIAARIIRGALEAMDPQPPALDLRLEDYDFS